MKKLLYILFAAALCGFAAGCDNDDDRKTAAVSIVEAQTFYPQALSTGLIKFKADKTVKAASNQEWCTTSVSGNTITVSVSENLSIETRNATISLTSEGETVTVDITQQGILLFFPSLKTAFSFKTDHAQTLDFNALPLPVTIESIPDWLDSSFENGILTLTTSEANGGAEIRAGEVVVSILGLEKRIPAAQITDPRSYYAFLGDYELAYNNNYLNTGANNKMTITLEEDVAGSTYLVKGILPSAQQALGEIYMQYDAENRGLKINGQIIGKNSSGYDLWFLPMNGLASSVSRSTNYGMVSVIEGDYWDTIEFTDSGYNPTGFFVVGFRVRFYEEATNRGEIVEAMCYAKMTKI